MKSLYLILSTFSLLLFGSCSMGITTSKYSIKEKTSDYNIDVLETFIDCKEMEDYLLIEPVNDIIGEIIDSLTYNTKTEAINYFSSFANKKARGEKVERPSFSYELITRDTVYVANKEIVSIRIMAYTFSGGAHGTTNFHSINYSPQNTKFLSIGDILNLKMRNYIDKAIKKNFKNKDGCFNFIPTLDLASVVNISEDSVVFTYEHYILGPYSCGYLVVEVPFKDIENAMLIKK